jgi:two-component system cell cycle sensor histidine kinase/response regulator CckA
LLAFARKQAINPQVLDLNETVESMLKMLRRLIGEDIELLWKPDKTCWPIKMDPSQIDQILANLCVNARDAIVGVGKITIETGAETFDEAHCAGLAGCIPGEFVFLAVSDNGCGMEKETLDNIFEPFFTTKQVGQGTGLGLATVYGIVKQNEGFINVYSESGRGTTFKIYIPRCAEQVESLPKGTLVSEYARGVETILLVEDEPGLLSLASQILTRFGYSVLTASTPGEAMQVAQEHADQIHLLITDVVMPEMNGKQMERSLRPFCPGIKCLFMSGYTGDIITHHGLLDNGVHFIQKPFSMQSLGAKVREMLDGR